MHLLSSPGITLGLPGVTAKPVKFKACRSAHALERRDGPQMAWSYMKSTEATLEHGPLLRSLPIWCARIGCGAMWPTRAATFRRRIAMSTGASMARSDLAQLVLFTQTAMALTVAAMHSSESP